MVGKNVRARTRGLRRRNNIQKPGFLGLRQKLLICFAATALVYLAITAMLIWALGNREFPDGIVASLQASVLGPSGLPPNGRSSGLQERIIVVVASVTFCVTGTLFLVVWKILKPLGGMVDAAKAITEGNLRGTVPVGSRDEIGMLGGLLNDLAANFQEVLLLVWNHTANSARALQEIKEAVQSQPGGGVTPSGITEHLRTVQEDLHAIQEVVRRFQFYRVTVGQEDVTRSS
jgi:methyl-accepting chemotaxis protein